MHGYTWLRPEARAQVSHAEVPVRGQPTGLCALTFARSGAWPAPPARSVSSDLVRGFSYVLAKFGGFVAKGGPVAPDLFP